jgi:tetratricopeptide (TPR) repeat protein
VTTLEEALRAQTKPDAQLLSDLAAAYIAAGDFQRAHETSERAWQLAQTPEIAWNRAVAAEHVDPPPVVIAKWNKYLELDPSSPWSAAARKRLDDFQEGLKYRR